MGANAGVMFNLAPQGAYGSSGVLSGSVTLTATQKAAIEGGQGYVNIHTSAHGSGELRGQAVPRP